MAPPDPYFTLENEFASHTGLVSITCKTGFAGIKPSQPIAAMCLMWGRALGDDLLRSAKGPLFETIKITVIDVGRLVEPALCEGL